MSGKYDPVGSSGGNSVGGAGGASIPLVGLGPNPGYFAGGAPAAAAGSNSGSYQNYAVNMGSGQQAAAPAAAGIAAAGSVKPSKQQQQPSGVAGIGQPALTSTGPGFSDQHSAPQTFGGSGGAPFVVAPTAPLSFMGAWQAALWGTGDSMAIVKCGNIGVRLVRRKLLFEARRKIGTLAFFVGALGLVIVLIDMELCIRETYDKKDSGSFLMKLLGTLSTLAAVALVLRYHYLDTIVYMIDNSMEDWRLTLTYSKLVRIVGEVVVLLIHPLPGDNDWTIESVEASSGEPSSVTSYITTPSTSVQTAPPEKIADMKRFPTDAVVAIPMVLRIFLLFRAIKLNSRIFEDVASQSLGALNKVKITFPFIFKAYMQISPGYCMLALVTSMFLWSSWSVRACEMYQKLESHLDDFWNAVWFTAVTALTIGYGDIVPVTHCGRAIAVITGFMGVAATAMVVAVLTRKLELSREEKYVNAFVGDVELSKRIKSQAADVIKHAWLVYRLRAQSGVAPDYLILRHHRRLLQAIHSMRATKEHKRNLQDSVVTIQEMYTMHNYMFQRIKDTHRRLTTDVDARLRALEVVGRDMSQKLDTLLLAQATAQGGPKLPPPPLQAR